MSQRRLTATAALFTAGLALIPAVGHAADGGPAAVQAPAASAGLEAARSAALETFDSPAEKSYRIPRELPKGQLSSRTAGSGRTLVVAPGCARPTPGRAPRPHRSAPSSTGWTRPSLVTRCRSRRVICRSR